MTPATFTIRRIRQPATREVFRLIAQLNHKMDFALFRKRMLAMARSNYFVLGAYEGKKLVGLTGCWIATKFYCGKYMEIDNFVVDEKLRGTGLGERIMRRALAEARKRRCESIVLNAYIWNEAAHRFYDRFDFKTIGKHRIIAL